MQDTASEFPDINARIGTRVHELRRDRGLTLDGLAAECGVSRSMLSLIERGNSSPTAFVLNKIATGLGVPLAALFDDGGAAAANPLSRAEDRTPWRDPESGYIRCNISSPGFPSPFKIVEVILPAGAKVAYENGPREIHQQIWVRDGSVEVAMGNVSYRLEKDDCLSMRLDEPTTFRNPTRKRARYVVVTGTELGRQSSS